MAPHSIILVQKLIYKVSDKPYSGGGKGMFIVGLVSTEEQAKEIEEVAKSFVVERRIKKLLS